MSYILTLTLKFDFEKWPYSLLICWHRCLILCHILIDSAVLNRQMLLVSMRNDWRLLSKPTGSNQQQPLALKQQFETHKIIPLQINYFFRSSSSFFLTVKPILTQFFGCFSLDIYSCPHFWHRYGPWAVGSTDNHPKLSQVISQHAGCELCLQHVFTAQQLSAHFHWDLQAEDVHSG